MHLVVVGGGITGLAAAFTASRTPGIDVTLLEARPEVGGKIGTISLRDARIELSADSFLPRDDVALQLCRDIGIGGELVSPADFGAWIYLKGRTHRFPAGTVLGFPASLRSLATTTLLSPAGKLRAAAELLARHTLSGPDVSVGEFARARLGAEVLERMIDPILAGTRAGSVDEMSLAAAIAPVDHAARNHHSVIAGLRRARRASGAAAPRFYAPEAGMHRIVEALEEAMPAVHLRRDTRVRSVSKTRGAFEVDTATGSVPADAVIVATPAHVTAALLEPISPEAAEGLRTIEHTSTAVINLLFPAGGIGLLPSGSGLLVPSSEGMTISGCTWFSSKWPALAAPGGTVTIRCFVGRDRRESSLNLSDADLQGVALRELSRITSVHSDPLASHTTRWDQGMPRYTVGHLQRVTAIERALAETPGIAVAGASYRGSGIPDCIAQAQRAVATVTGAMRR